jgi:TonB family protein
MFSELKEKGLLSQGFKPLLRRNLICLLASIILHSLLVLVFINVASPIKVIQFEEEVTDLIIVPPEALLLPEGYEDFPGAGLNEDPFLRPSPRGGESSSTGLETDVEAAVAADIPSLLEREPPSGEQKEQEPPSLRGRLVSRSELSSAFRLRIPGRADLDLSEKTKKDSEAIGAYDYRDRKSIDFSEYLRPDLTKILPSGGQSSSGRTGSGRGGRQAKASFKVQDYDINPWAERVVNRIQSNWIVPLRQVALTRNVVGISVTVERNGDLSSVGIINSSQDQTLDQAALEAVNKSSPFPNLPADFPHKNLEAVFVFQYYD